MKKYLILLVLCLSIWVSLIKAQPTFFIYLQAENNEPFSVTVNNNTYHADKNGYLIISKLKSGNLFLKVFFPMNKYPIHHFAVDVQNDFGFLLKPIDNTNWQLESFQGLGTIRSGQLLGANKTSANAQPIVPITNKASKAVDTVDAAIRKTVEKKPLEQIVKAPTSANPKVATNITKEKEFMANEGLLQQYIDASGTTKDTIQLLILNNSKPDTAKPTVKKATYDKPCTIASMDEFLKVRLRMAAATSEEGMLDAAKEWFVLYCFSTEQVKNLSVLFLTQIYKLRFFGLALPRIYDANNVTGLQSQLTDPVFLQQFKLLLQ